MEWGEYFPPVGEAPIIHSCVQNDKNNETVD